MATAWPASVRPLSFGFYPDNPDRSGGASLSGHEQFVSSSGGRWRAAGTFTIKTKEQILALRALRSRLRGRANTITIGNYDGRRLSWPVSAQTGLVLHPGRTRRKQLDGTVYEDPEVPATSEIIATVQTTAALRATQIAINKTQGGALVAGQQFGIGSRLYEIYEIVSVVGSVTTVNFWPELRAAATATTAVLFTRPVCEMHCLNLNDALRMLDTMRFAQLGLDFVEAFP